MKYALISEQQLKIIQDALNQSEIWNRCGHTLETRAQAEEILESLKPSEPKQEPVAWRKKVNGVWHYFDKSTPFPCDDCEPLHEKH